MGIVDESYRIHSDLKCFTSEIVARVVLNRKGVGSSATITLKEVQLP